jgi:hypothetical protein
MKLSLLEGLGFDDERYHRASIGWEPDRDFVTVRKTNG